MSTASPRLYTRAEFEQLHRRAASRQRRDSWLLVVASLGLAVLLVLAIVALRDAMGRTAHLLATLVLFLVYLVMLGGVLFSLRVRLERMRAVCPQCGVTLNLLGEYVALSEGMCNSCGGQVIE